MDLRGAAMVSHTASHLRYLSCSMSGLVGDLTATSNQDVDKIIEEVLSDNISVDRVETTGPPQHIQSSLFAHTSLHAGFSF